MELSMRTELLRARKVIHVVISREKLITHFSQWLEYH